VALVSIALLTMHGEKNSNDSTGQIFFELDLFFGCHCKCALQMFISSSLCRANPAFISMSFHESIIHPFHVTTLLMFLF
jgi:hypothetical protein